jgi:N-acetylglucosaminyldiphosphoundecaprenol N-acetyl-beta-D-mannosaminyltransferase
MNIPATNILGVVVSAVGPPAALHAMDHWIARGEGHYVCVTGVHGIVESWRDKSIRTIHNRAGMVVPDGMPLVWLSKLRGFSGVERVYGPDLMLAACRRFLPSGRRHFFYGGNPGVASLLAAKLGRDLPGIQIAGTWTPPFRPLTPDEDRDVVEMINAAKPHFVWVGLSTPRQERWMAEHAARLGPAILVGCGAAFDFNAGLKRQAPQWMRRAGLEWCFRLLAEPRRLWRRYLINNPTFVGLLLLDICGLRNTES